MREWKRLNVYKIPEDIFSGKYEFAYYTGYKYHVINIDVISIIEILSDLLSRHHQIIGYYAFRLKTERGL